MPKAAVKTPICDICGVEAREGSLFCYNCGGSLKQAALEETTSGEVEAKPATPTNGAGKANSPAVGQRRDRRRRPGNRGPVEIVWEPKEGFSPVYVIGAVVLLTLALVLFVVAMWIK